MGEKEFTLLVSENQKGERLDVFIASSNIGLTRSAAQRAIKEGLVTVSGVRRPQGYRLKGGEEVKILLPQKEEKDQGLEGLVGPQREELPILYEDPYLLAVAKRPGLVVHPGAGHRTGTLVSLLLASGRRLSTIGGPERAGLVHRLDKETSGVLLVAKDDWTHAELARQFKERLVSKAYLALVLGAHIKDSGTIKTFYGRRPSDRRQFTSRVKSEREAITEYRTLARASLCALVLARPLTGRTHQIRVHLAEHGHPVVGDHVYGRAYPRKGSEPEREVEVLRTIGRTALHAWALLFVHPKTGQKMRLFAPVPSDLEEAFSALFGNDWTKLLPKDPFSSK